VNVLKGPPTIPCHTAPTATTFKRSPTCLKMRTFQVLKATQGGQAQMPGQSCKQKKQLSHLTQIIRKTYAQGFHGLFKVTITIRRKSVSLPLVAGQDHLTEGAVHLGKLVQWAGLILRQEAGIRLVGQRIQLQEDGNRRRGKDVHQSEAHLKDDHDRRLGGLTCLCLTEQIPLGEVRQIEAEE